MTDGSSGPLARPVKGRNRWTSFVAPEPSDGRPVRQLHEQGNQGHRARVEHDKHTLLVHVSDEDGHGWTTVALDRATRGWAVAQRDTQRDAATAAYGLLYDDSRSPAPGPGSTGQDGSAVRG